MRFSNLSRQYTAVWRQTNAIYDAWAKRHGLTYPELLAVLSLSAPGPAPRGRRKLRKPGCSARQSVRTILQGFAKRGWLTLEPCQADRRKKRIVLSREGQAAVRRIARALGAVEAAVWQTLGEKRTESLIKTTALYNELFEEAAGRRPHRLVET